MRRLVVELADRARAAGNGVLWVAERLEMAARTLWSWLADRAKGLLDGLRRRGGSRTKPERWVRRAVLEILYAHPQIGVRRLAKAVPGLSRRTVADWKERVRRRKARSAALEAHRCVWHVPGRVWAMDHTDLPVPLEDGTRKVLVVRDLASGMVLSDSPALSGTAEEVITELERLFDEHGVPLVIKCDNGSPLVAELVRELLARRQAVALRSPPRRPSYNGAEERGHGWLKLLLPGCAAAAGRDEVWRAEDLEAAMGLANELPRERRPPAREVWESREAISHEERQRFLTAYREAYEAERERLELKSEEVPPGSRLDATIGRRAARAALCELEYLTIRRR